MGTRRLGRAAAGAALSVGAQAGARSAQRSGACSVLADNGFPLAVSGSNRYVQTAGGTPFLVHFEAAWFIQKLSLANAETYLDDLVAKGINGIRVMAAMHFGGGPVANVNGHFAFTTAADFTTAFVTAYWDHLASIVAAANARGIVVSLVPLYYGFDGDGSQGWWLVVAAKSAAQSQTYGAAVATRFLAYPNVIWEGLGDFVPPENTRSSALIAGLRSVSPARLCTGEPARGEYSSDLQPTGGNWDINFAYAFQATYVECLVAYAQNVGPVGILEPYYEHRTNPTITVRQTRAQMWFAATSGSYVYCYGNERIWDFDSGFSPDGAGHSPYTAAFSDPGRLHYKAHGEFLRSIAWWRLAPDTGSSLVTAGRGTNGSESYVTVSKSSGPQNLALIYIPNGGSITVALSGFSGSVTVEYVDPTTGGRSAAAGSPFAASGSQIFVASTAKGNNAAGDPDWAILLTSP
jgi:hypothetical protein